MAVGKRSLRCRRQVPSACTPWFTSVENARDLPVFVSSILSPKGAIAAGRQPLLHPANSIRRRSPTATDGIWRVQPGEGQAVRQTVASANSDGNQLWSSISPKSGAPDQWMSHCSLRLAFQALGCMASPLSVEIPSTPAQKRMRRRFRCHEKVQIQTSASALESVRNKRPYRLRSSITIRRCGR